MKAAKRSADSRTAHPSDLPPWLRFEDGGTRLLLHVQPKARRTAIVGVYGERLKVAVQSPPQDGRANETLTHQIAAMLGIGAADVRIATGSKSRRKTLRIEGVDARDVLERIETLMR